MLVRRKATEGDLERGAVAEEPLGVRGVEWSEGCPGNWREPGVRPGKRDLPITGRTGKWWVAERQSERAVVVVIGGTTQPAGSEGPLLYRCGSRTGRDPDECRIG